MSQYHPYITKYVEDIQKHIYKGAKIVGQKEEELVEQIIPKQDGP